MKFIVGAYAASPSHSVFRKDQESKLYQFLREHKLVGGLEIPFTGKLHSYDPHWFYQQLDREWENVATTIPGVMQILKSNPNFGLSSESLSGRREAIRFVRKLRSDIFEVNKILNVQSIKFVELHSAPSMNPSVRSSKEALRDSIAEIRAWDWKGIALTLEHCDSGRSDYPPNKGFLPIEDEIWAILETRRSSTPMGVTINWARSALETRDPENAIYHIELCKKYDLLTGVMFSGVTINDPNYGHWSDSHAPFKGNCSTNICNNNLLLTQNRIRNCLNAAKYIAKFHGIKIQVLPQPEILLDRVKCIDDALGTCEAASK